MILFLLGLVSLITWIIVIYFKFERVPWAHAFAAMVTLGVAMVAYRQWRAARHEISIDKYYDRLDAVNRRLELLTNKPTNEEMHVFAELDKLEYVIAKYELGYISPILAFRALQNFQSLCTDRPEFLTQAQHWVNKAAYRDMTRDVVAEVCARCQASPPREIR